MAGGAGRALDNPRITTERRKQKIIMPAQFSADTASPLAASRREKCCVIMAANRQRPVSTLPRATRVLSLLFKSRLLFYPPAQLSGFPLSRPSYSSLREVEKGRGGTREEVLLSRRINGRHFGGVLSVFMPCSGHVLSTEEVKRKLLSFTCL